MAPLRSIFVPLDGSPFAEQALTLAVTLARAAKARHRLVLVHQSPEAPKTAGGNPVVYQDRAGDPPG